MRDDIQDFTSHGNVRTTLRLRNGDGNADLVDLSVVVLYNSLLPTEIELVATTMSRRRKQKQQQHYNPDLASTHRSPVSHRTADPFQLQALH